MPEEQEIPLSESELGLRTEMLRKYDELRRKAKGYT